MIKLDLLEKIGLSIDALTTDEKQLVKIEKLLKAEKQFDEKISTDDIEHLLVFLKSDWQNFKELLVNKNIQNLLFDKGNYVLKRNELEVNYKQATAFLETHFYENISQKMMKLMRKNQWEILIDIQDQYPFILSGAMQEIIYSKLKSNVEVILSLVHQKTTPNLYKFHFSLQEDFYVFLGDFDPDIFEPIEDQLHDILLMPIEGHGEDFYNYFNELKKKLTKGSKEATTSEGCSERTWTIMGYTFTFFVFVLLYLLLIWNNALFWIQIIAMFAVTKITTYENHLKEEREKAENKGEVILSEKYWKQRNIMFYFFICFVMGFVLSLPIYGYYLLSNSFTFLKPIGVIFTLFMIWGFYRNAKDEKEKEKEEEDSKKQK